MLCLNQYYAPAEATAQWLADAAEDLARAGHEVTVVCGDRSYPEPHRLGPRQERRNGVAVYRTRCTGFGRGSGRALDYLTFLLGATARLIRLRRPDVLIAMSTPPMLSLLGLVAARLWRARSVYWVMDAYPEVAFALGALRRGSVVGCLVRAAASYTLRRSDLVIAIGQTMAERLRQAGARHVAVAHEWIDGTSVCPRPVSGHPLRRERGWDDRVVFLYSGNVGLAHEFDTLLDAAELLRDRPEILFAFVVHGSGLATLQREVDRRGLSSFRFLPFAPRSALGESLTAGDVHLATLRAELAGLLVPVKVYASLAAGRPCLFVGPSECDVARMLREGQCGACFAPGDARGLAAAMLDYAGDAARREREGHRARRFFEERLDKPAGLRVLRELIETLGSR